MPSGPSSPQLGTQNSKPGTGTSRRDTIFFILTGFFLTNALLAEVIGGKLFQAPAIDWTWLKFPAVPLSIGLLPWPVVFITTDIINEYYGKPAVRRLSFLAVAMISYAFLVLYAARAVPTWSGSGVTHEAFAQVAGQSMWIIIGSIIAFLTAQLVDVGVFWFIKHRTGHKMLWLRATGSTAVSQLIDTFIVQYIGLVLPRQINPESWGLKMDEYVLGASTSYVYKLLVAIAITPLIYLVHRVIDRYLGLGTAQAMEHSAERASNG